MNCIRLSLLAVIGSFLLGMVVVQADIRLRVPEDIEPPVYTSAAGPAFQTNGTLFSVHDSEWAAIPFLAIARMCSAELQSSGPGRRTCCIWMYAFGQGVRSAPKTNLQPDVMGSERCRRGPGLVCFVERARGGNG